MEATLREHIVKSRRKKPWRFSPTSPFADSGGRFFKRVKSGVLSRGEIDRKTQESQVDILPDLLRERVFHEVPPETQFPCGFHL